MIKYLKKLAKREVAYIYEEKIGTFFFKQKGFCPCCEQEVVFMAHNPWLRDHFKCLNITLINR